MDFSQIINGFYNDQSGFYGIPLDVCATYIVLFTIYGAVLDATGRGPVLHRHQLRDVPPVAVGARAHGHAVRLPARHGVRLGHGDRGQPRLGGLADPAAGRLPARAGRRACSPRPGSARSCRRPTLGAAAFIIAEYVGVPYLQVLLWATIPTVLYYVGILLAVEIDARRFGARAVTVPTRAGREAAAPLRLPLPLPRRDRRLSRAGHPAVPGGGVRDARGRRVRPGRAGRVPARPAGSRHRAGVARRRPGAYGVDLYRALAVGRPRGAARRVRLRRRRDHHLGHRQDRARARAWPTCWCAAARALAPNPTAVLILSALFAAVAIAVLGLAVPVTASFIIAWVIIGPALQTLGVSPAETAMFIFYYAVLSEVTPPTALAAVAAAAITGGNTIATMWQAWKYTLPAFLAPIAFVITDNGSHLLMQGGVWSVVWTDRGVDRRRRCAGRGHRRLDRRSGHPGAAAALRAGRAPAALPRSPSPSASASPSSPPPSPPT